MVESSATCKALLIGSNLGTESVGRAIAKKRIAVKDEESKEYLEGVPKDIAKMRKLMEIKGV